MKPKSLTKEQRDKIMTAMKEHRVKADVSIQVNRVLINFPMRHRVGQSSPLQLTTTILRGMFRIISTDWKQPRNGRRTVVYHLDTN